MKSERIKKLESELNDLQQWMNLGLVPKKDVEKHKREIDLITQKIVDEEERIRLIRENGDAEEYSMPRKSVKQGYQEHHTIPDVDTSESDLTDAGIDMDEGTEKTYEYDDSTDERTTYDDDDDPFSDRNRWRRGILEDPEANDW